MRHGRKTKRVRIDGYKRHVLTDLDTELVPAVGVTPANVGEDEVADQITADLAAQNLTLKVEHTLAHLGRWQGRRAAYLGQRKNLFDRYAPSTGRSALAA